MFSVILYIFTGEIAMFGANETYQRALLQWQRAAAQGERFDFEISDNPFLSDLI